MIGYNQSDTATGWFHFLAGLTLYYSDPEEATLDPLYSVSMPPGTVPMLSIVQLHTIKLGKYDLKCNDSTIQRQGSNSRSRHQSECCIMRKAF